MKWIKKNIASFFLTAALMSGMGLILYPSLSDYWNSFHQSRIIMDYASELVSISTDEYADLIESARLYNEELAKTGIKWDLTDEERGRYLAELNAFRSGAIGYIDIPKINVLLPLYHGTSEEILQTSIGHLEGTSLPVGGQTAHCVLSGHRGLPSARLFTDLDKLVSGDTWTIHVLNETLTYETDQIRIIEPDDLSALALQEGKDYCTLVTCTPYGINTHRLLVRGRRIENAHGEAAVTADALQIEPVYIAPFLAVPVLILLVIMVLFSTGADAQSRKGSKAERYLKERGLGRRDRSDTAVLIASRPLTAGKRLPGRKNMSSRYGREKRVR